MLFFPSKILLNKYITNSAISSLHKSVNAIYFFGLLGQFTQEYTARLPSLETRYTIESMVYNNYSPKE